MGLFLFSIDEREHCYTFLVPLSLYFPVSFFPSRRRPDPGLDFTMDLGCQIRHRIFKKDRIAKSILMASHTITSQLSAIDVGQSYSHGLADIE